MSPDDKRELRNLYNHYRSTKAAADGLKSGKRVQAQLSAERQLQFMIWLHMEDIINLVTEKQ